MMRIERTNEDITLTVDDLKSAIACCRCCLDDELGSFDRIEETDKLTDVIMNFSAVAEIRYEEWFLFPDDLDITDVQTAIASIRDCLSGKHSKELVETLKEFQEYEKLLEWNRKIEQVEKIGLLNLKEGTELYNFMEENKKAYLESMKMHT